ncbi:MAG: DUF3021 domain-containing protein [Oscillospiraceae bacterium]|jgi:hypothetical protein|nr:DUF3021 domain-containing protein [Oscillospiraceae bacterium]
MLINDKKRALARALTGGILGMAFCLLLGWLSQPGAIFGSSLGLNFTFCYNSHVPELLGASLGFLLWFLFGAEIGVATLPFADGGKSLLLRSLAHFAAMTLTMWAWVLLNFPYEPLPGLVLSFQLPLTLIYLLIWLGRWVGWYAEVTQIREKLGLSPRPSFLKWKETLPHMGFAGVLCLLVPTVLRLCDDVVPIFSMFFAFILLPAGGFTSALSLGKRQGFCPLYPLACVVFTLVFALTARLYTNIDDSILFPIAFLSPLLGNFAGAGIQRFLRQPENKADI